MTMIKHLFMQSRRTMLLAIFASMLSAAIGVTLIASINYVLEHDMSSLGYGVSFYIAMLLLLFVSGLWSQKLLVSLGHDMVYNLRLKLVGRILQTSLERQEQLGAPVLYNALTRDVTVIANATKQLPISLYNGLLLLAGAVYLGWLSPLLFISSWVIIGLGIWGDFALAGRIKAIMKEVRQLDEDLFCQYQALVEGRNELRLSEPRRRFLKDKRIEPCASNSRKKAIKADIIWAINLNWTTVLVFSLVGLVFFLGLTFDSISKEVVVGYVLTAMFLRTPIAMILDAIPSVLRGNVALQAIDKLVLGDIPNHKALAQTPKFTRLLMQQVYYQYPSDAGEKGFTLGPIDFTLNAGELIFLIGGNGSGKSTLAKLLTGLYLPSSGKIAIDKLVLDKETQDQYGAYFSTIFPNFYLFDDILDNRGSLGDEADPRINYYLERLSIKNKVHINNGQLSTTALSQGQRKRLALLFVYMEERQILLLDEWAADQDPVFREVFYREILPELKAAGKIIIAVTHDDHYFDVADKVYRLNNGTIHHFDTKTQKVFSNAHSYGI